MAAAFIEGAEAGAGVEVGIGFCDTPCRFDGAVLLLSEDDEELAEDVELTGGAEIMKGAELVRVGELVVVPAAGSLRLM
jgi:hypothetical protein